MKVVVTRVQRGVGQGGFHNSRILLQRGHIFDSDLPFEFTYDCGTNSVGPQRLAIEPFLARHIADYEPADALVDALFISHLDRDHYNGAEQLCKVKKVKRIFLPYFTIEELILMLWEQIADGITVSPAFANAMASITRGNRQLFGIPVTVIGGDAAKISHDSLPRNSAGSGDRLEAVLLGDDGQYYSIGDDIPACANIGLVARGKPLPWVLRPWSYKQTAAAQDFMKQLIAGIPELGNLLKPGAIISDADIANLRNKKDSIRAACQSIIAKSPQTIATDYKDNNTPSICLYSGPKSRMAHRYSTAYIERGTPESILLSNPIGWITTGDVLMKRHWSEFITCFKDVLGLTGTFVIPHHGAENNHSSEFARATAGRLAVICARQRSDDHPHYTVLDELYANNAIVRHVNEYDAHGLYEVATLEAPGI